MYFPSVVKAQVISNGGVKRLFRGRSNYLCSCCLKKKIVGELWRRRRRVTNEMLGQRSVEHKMNPGIAGEVQVIGYFFDIMNDFVRAMISTQKLLRSSKSHRGLAIGSEPNL